MMSNLQMYEGLLKLFQAQDNYVGQAWPVEESPGLIRVPAFDNGQWLDQGGVFRKKGDGFRVLLDDGRRSDFSDLAEAWEWFVNECVIWKDDITDLS